MSLNDTPIGWRTFAVLTAMAACALPAYAAPNPPCVGNTPVSVARWVWKHSPRLVTPDSVRFISADFLTAIQRDAAQAKANNEICALCGGDLWTDSQEGYAGAPMAFKEARRNGDNAEVVYSFRFSIERSGPSEPRSTRIVLRKEAGCWKIDDLVNGSGSLRSLAIVP